MRTARSTDPIFVVIICFDIILVTLERDDFPDQLPTFPLSFLWSVYCTKCTELQGRELHNPILLLRIYIVDFQITLGVICCSERKMEVPELTFEFGFKQGELVLLLIHVSCRKSMFITLFCLMRRHFEVFSWKSQDPQL